MSRGVTVVPETRERAPAAMCFLTEACRMSNKFYLHIPTVSRATVLARGFFDSLRDAGVRVWDRFEVLCDATAPDSALLLRLIVSAVPNDATLSIEVSLFDEARARPAAAALNADVGTLPESRRLARLAG
jgi:hypothetical protein